MFSGTLTAMITPFIDGHLDEEGLRKNIAYQVEAGVCGLLFLGTTGELPTLTEYERRKVIEIGLEAKIPVIINVGTNSTRETLERVEEARGADGLLVITPYYNKPTQEGLFRHFEAVANSTTQPIIIYHIPKRTGVTLEVETIHRIATLENVVAIKESSQDLNFASSVKDITLLSGDDSATLPLMALGAKGVISVLSNLVPEQVVALTTAALEGDFAKARLCHAALFDLMQAMSVETNPIPIKYAMNEVGLAAGEVRLPLCEPQDENKRIIEKALCALAY